LSRELLAVGLAAGGLLLQGCATKPVVYGPIGPEAPYGYQDAQNADGGHTVRVAMPGQAAPEALRAFFDRRAGELCPAGVARANVFRMNRDGYASAPYVHGGVSVGTRTWIGAELEGYVYCKPEPTAAKAEPAPAS